MVRDQTCRYPGCDSSARTADLDHVVEWRDGGATSAANLGSLCAAHHLQKTLGGLTVTQDESGVQTWTTAEGRVAITHPEVFIDPSPLTDHAASRASSLDGDDDEPLPF
jgi:hypothetical protein